MQTEPQQSESGADGLSEAEQDELMKMKIVELKEELDARGLETTGLKSALMERLRRALAEEKKNGGKKSDFISASTPKLFVGQVPSTLSEDELKKVFSPYGDVKEATILKERRTGNHRGCGFVTFANKSEANAAIEALNDKVKLPGAKREMIVRPAGKEEDKKEHKLYVGMLSRKSVEDDVRKIFEPYGDVLEVFVMRDKDTGASKGCGFVKFPTRDEALRAINALHGRKRDKDSPAQLQVRFAQTKQEKLFQNKFPRMGNSTTYPASLSQLQSLTGLNPMAQSGLSFPQQFYFPGLQTTTGISGLSTLTDPLTGGIAQSPGGPMQTGPNGANLFIYNLPDAYDDHDLASLFSNFGQVLSTKVQKDKMTGASKGYGFVSFDNVRSAQSAIQSMDGFVIGSKKLAVRVKKGDGGPVESGPTSSRPINSYSPY